VVVVPKEDERMAEGSDRYLIYKMLGRSIEMIPPMAGRRRSPSGFVDRLCRNIFENLVEMTVGGRRYTFKEPTSIEVVDGEVVEGEVVEGVIVFVYGGESPANDDEVFRLTALGAHSGATLYDVRGSTGGSRESRLTFRFGPKEKSTRAYRRRKAAAA
jgi:hypothetical protein